VRVILPDDVDPFVFLFSESAGRAIVAVPRTEEVRFTDMCTARGLPAVRIGVLDILESAIEVQDQFRIPLRELRVAWTSTLPALFG
jgi:phosphoribosylformylglycinamidine synthase